VSDINKHTAPVFPKITTTSYNIVDSFFCLNEDLMFDMIDVLKSQSVDTFSAIIEHDVASYVSKDLLMCLKEKYPAVMKNFAVYNLVAQAAAFCILTGYRCGRFLSN